MSVVTVALVGGLIVVTACVIRHALADAADWCSGWEAYHLYERPRPDWSARKVKGWHAARDADR